MDQKRRPLLVQSGILQYILSIKSELRNLISIDNNIVAESEINLAQAIAKCIIIVNPKLIDSNVLMDSVSFMVSRLLDKEVHHHLLNYEGLLAFTNLTSFESEIRIKIIELYSVNDSINSLLYSENDEVGIAAIEFLANLSADSAMEKKFYSTRPPYTKYFIQRLNTCDKTDIK